MRATLALALVLAALALCACQRTNVVQLEYLGVRATAMSGPGSPAVIGALGFTCSEPVPPGSPPGPPLAQRLLTAGSGCLVVDVYGAVASASPDPSATACRTFNVSTDLQSDVARYVEPVDAATLASCSARAADPREVAQCVLGDTAGDTATQDAPDGLIVLRAVLLAGACPATTDDVAMTRAADLVGCAYSCPTVLDSVSGPLLLYLPVDATTCTQSSAEMANCLALPPVHMH